MLYLIEILHQTTTNEDSPLFCYSCILSKFYIKPQLDSELAVEVEGCILSKFYIKPQLKRSQPVCLIVVSYRNSTSNHNLLGGTGLTMMLYLIEILHQTTTNAGNAGAVVVLYLIEILHQTTTRPAVADGSVCCILSKFYIKPQLSKQSLNILPSCILSKFYIKPQRRQSL